MIVLNSHGHGCIVLPTACYDSNKVSLVHLSVSN